MPTRDAIIKRVSPKDFQVIAFCVLAYIMGSTMMLRGLLLLFGKLMDYEVSIVQLTVFNLWSIHWFASVALLCITGALCIAEGFRSFNNCNVSLFIRTFVIALFWSYVAPATWNSFAHPDVTPFIVGALSMHIPLGVPYTVLAWLTRQSCGTENGSNVENHVAAQ